ncbi:MAG: hypothetical protein WCX79_00245 [Candidatus Paceibacterota bacterium]|jgi:hypothetical protein
METKSIEAQISIIAGYDDVINITVEDKSSSTKFLQMTMTREQFVNATMNRLCNTEVQTAKVQNLDRVGKKMELRPFTFELPVGVHTYDSGLEQLAGKMVRNICPDGWIPDTHFGSRGSFYTEDGKVMARTTLRKWV